MYEYFSFYWRENWRMIRVQHLRRVSVDPFQTSFIYIKNVTSPVWRCTLFWSSEVKIFLCYSKFQIFYPSKVHIIHQKVIYETFQHCFYTLILCPAYNLPVHLIHTDNSLSQKLGIIFWRWFNFIKVKKLKMKRQLCEGEWVYALGVL